MPAANTKTTRKGPLRCPYCGNDVDFCLYLTTCRVQHWRQTSAMRFKRTSINPSKLNIQATPLLVCASCAYPLGAPPQSITAKRSTHS